MARRVPLIVAHRGASHDAPENTLPAFRLAFEQGVDAIEGDFRQTADGEIVCVHDATTARCGDRNLVVRQSTLAELRTVDAGRWKGEAFAGTRIPTLAEVLTTVPTGKVAYLEIKAAPRAVPAIVAAIAAGPVPARNLRLISFNSAVIAACKRALPRVQAFWLVEFRQSRQTRRVTPTDADILKTLAACNADGVGVQARPEIAGPNFASRLRTGRYSFHVWTVDSTETADHFRALGVDSITTNRPAMIRAHLS